MLEGRRFWVGGGILEDMGLFGSSSLPRYGNDSKKKKKGRNREKRKWSVYTTLGSVFPNRSRKGDRLIDGVRSVGTGGSALAALEALVLWRSDERLQQVDTSDTSETSCKPDLDER
jgi:hypothetical protein